MLLNWRFIDLPSRSTVIDLPIEAKHVPNFFVEATLVRNGRLHTEARELFVPPVKGLLNVAIRTGLSAGRDWQGIRGGNGPERGTRARPGRLDRL